MPRRARDLPSRVAQLPYAQDLTPPPRSKSTGWLNWPARRPQRPKTAAVVGGPPWGAPAPPAAAP
eukprot:13538037-Alexandrium_andersonii.AAC.1